MANDYNNKRYYWIKLKETFMTGDIVDFLMSQKNGANYVVLYQMLCLKTANTQGDLATKFGEIIVPYNVEKIQRDCKYFDVDTIRVALDLYKNLNLIFVQENGVLKIANHAELLGSESQNNIYKQGKKSVKNDNQGKIEVIPTTKLEKFQQDSNVAVGKIPTAELEKLQQDSNCSVGKTPIDKEIDKDIRDRLDIDQSESKRSARVREGEGTHTEFRESTLTAEAKFIIPTLEEVKAYCAEIKCSVDAERFIDYHAACGWRLNATPIRDWRALLRCWSKNGNDALYAARANKGGKTVAQAHFAQEREYSKQELAAIFNRDISEFV